MKSILLLGDSHTFGPYGRELEKLFAAAGWNVTRVGWVGARADHYLDGKQERIGLGGTGDWSAAKGKHYDVAVVTLGTNEAAGLPAGGSADAAATKILKLAQGLDADTVWYVGPPAFEAGIARTYNPAFAQDDLNARAGRVWDAALPLFTRMIDPRVVTRPFVLSTDIHLGPKGGAAWAQQVFGAVTGSSLSTTGSSPGAGLVLALAGLGLVAWWWMKRRK